jgi:UDP-N-acetylmuramate--alanine ligase
VLIVVPVYAAGEEPISGVTAEKLVDRIKQFGHRDVSYAPGFGEAQKVLKTKLQCGDLLLTLGAGDIWKVGEEFLNE